jgi:hypothetical protein
LRSKAAAADSHHYLPWVMLGIRASFREDIEFSPAEAVFGSQLPGQFINTAESPSPSFLNDLQTTMAGRPPPPQLSTSSITTTGGATAGPLCTGPPGRRSAAIVASLRQTLPSAGAVNTFLSPREGRENRQDVHAPPQSSPDTGRYGASRAAQRSPRCADATCPRATAETAGAAVTGDLQPSTDNATNNIVIIIISIRPPASQRPAAKPTQPLSLPPQSYGGTCDGVPSFPTTFPALTIT